jgi:death on curing protein
MSEWRWVPLNAVFAIHDMQLAEHGGLDGVRDKGAIESAIAKPQQLAAYGQPDIAELTAAYTYGVAQNHGFTDGKKRTAWVITNVFLDINGYEIEFSATDAYAVVNGLAEGSISEDQLAAWFRARLKLIR